MIDKEVRVHHADHTRGDFPIFQNRIGNPIVLDGTTELNTVPGSSRAGGLGKANGFEFRALGQQAAAGVHSKGGTGIEEQSGTRFNGQGDTCRDNHIGGYMPGT
ncbi:MAG: hypothetical protein BWY71_01660 [Planctomycetes bacterium ADurb.Bin412]|nr:MAG: hypothetical protein BWY71_01660 [Planctomycetes bacterium ADurb.Bin412]